MAEKLITVDIIICTIISKQLKILLIKRKNDPFKDRWAIPGGSVELDKNETLEVAAKRELREETNLTDIPVKQLKAYDDPKRDPRNRIITVAYYALIPYDEEVINKIKAKSDAKDTKWISLRRLPRLLAFDHRLILKDFLSSLKHVFIRTGAAFNFVPKKFTWKDLQEVYETALEKRFHATNFRRYINDRFILKGVGYQEVKKGRPPELFTYIKNREGYKK